MSTPQPSNDHATEVMSNRVLAGSLIGAPVIIALATSFVLDHEHQPAYWVYVAQVVAAAAIHATVEAVGYRAQPLATSLDDRMATTAALMAWRQTQIIRFALCESVAIISLAGAFIIIDGGFWIMAAGAVVSIVLMVVHVWPGARPVDKVASALEANGRRSGLREMFGSGGPGSGLGGLGGTGDNNPAIREL